MKITLPVDGSDCSNRAVEFVTQKLRKECASLTVDLLTVHPPIPYPRAVAVIGDEKAREYYREDGEAALKSARQMLEAAGIAYEPHILIGDPADTIAQHAGKSGADQVVMGTHGRGSAGRLLMGSVAIKVVQFCPVPVLLVK